MPPIMRLYDYCLCGLRQIGIYITASQNVFSTNLGVVRAPTVDMCYCLVHQTIGFTYTGSPTTNVNNFQAHRERDQIILDGLGYALMGDQTVIVDG